MPKFQVMTPGEVLRLLRDEVYRVDLDTGAVYGPGGHEVTPYPSGREGRQYLFVRLYEVFKGVRKTKTLAVQRLVWMAGTGEAIPPGFEVHHDDEETLSNAFDNLICLHKIDHRKKHRQGMLSDEPIPF